jgi:hypothetical protein
MPTQTTATAETVTLTPVEASFFDRHFVAGWYASLSMWLGLLGTLFLPALDYIQPLMDTYFPSVAEALQLTPLQRALIPMAIAALIPPARAWRQKVMQAKALKQAALTGVISSQPGTSAVEVAVPGVEPVIFVPPGATL